MLSTDRDGRRIRSVVLSVLSVVGCLVAVATPAVAQNADRAGITCDPVTRTDAVADPTLVSFDPQTNERIVDTRDGLGGVEERVDAGCTLAVDMSGLGSDSPEAYALSVTVISPDRGFFTVFPCSDGLPGTSSLNARAGVPTANLVVGVPDADAMICVFSQLGGHVVIDVGGWWNDEGINRFRQIDPTRAYDSRAFEPAATLPADGVRDVLVGGEFVPDDAVSVSVNVAAVNPRDRGFLVVYPCGRPRPLASNLNFVAGEKRAVSAIVELGPRGTPAEGRICVSSDVRTDFIVDVTGYDAPSSPTSPDLVLEPVADTRIVDTRADDEPGVRFSPRSTQRFDLSGVIDRPDESVAVVLNVVAVLADEGSFLSVDPCARSAAVAPSTSSLNYDTSQTANLVVTALSDDAEFCVYTDTAVDVVIDLVGVVAGPDDSLVNQLSLTDGDGFVPLEQDFAVDASDSTLHCDADLDLDLRLGLAPGVSATVNGRTVGSLDPSTPDIAVDLPVDGLLSVELRRGPEAAEYHVRCLPDDFPTLNVDRNEVPSQGWYLTNLSTSDGGGGSFLAILDERGVVVWYLRLDSTQIDAKLDSEGNILVAPPTPIAFGIDGTVGYRTHRLDGGFVAEQLTDSVDQPTDKHDYVEIPSLVPALPDRRAMVTYPLLFDQDLSELDISRTRANSCPGSVVGPGQTVVDGSVRELSGADDLLWEWNVSDHFGDDEVRFPLCFGNYDDLDAPGEVDVFHVNALDRIAEPGCEPLCDYLVTARHLDAVIRVDRDPDPGDPFDRIVDWILSSAPSDPADPEYVENLSGAPRLRIVDDPLGGPRRMHDARLVGDVVSMHDNQTASGNPSRYVEYRIDTDAMTATLIRQIDAPFGQTSGSLGSARPAPDGSVLVGWGNLQPLYVEYDQNDVELQRIFTSPGVNSYRIVKYGPGAFDADRLRATAGNTIEAPPS